MANMMRFAPGIELGRMQREIDRLFSDVLPAINHNTGTKWTPRTDLAETDDAYLFRLDVPGIVKDDLEINFRDGVLSISGERTEQKTDESAKSIRIERGTGKFNRRFSLPADIRAEEIAATYVDGVLTVTVPKQEAAKPIRISVN